MTDSPWLTPEEASTRARKAKCTVYAALRAGDLKGRQLTHHGRWTIHVDALDAWLDAPLVKR